MKTVFNNIIPFKGFLAMCLWPYIFVREQAASKYTVVVNNHEHIHADQQKEMLVVGLALAFAFYWSIGFWSLLFIPIFLWWYLIEWFIRLFCKGNAYMKIAFEQEAYVNKNDLAYLSSRKRFAWIKYLFN